jgi:hypothetical protein
MKARRFVAFFLPKGGDMFYKAMKMCFFAMALAFLAGLNAWAGDDPSGTSEEKMQAVSAGMGLELCGAMEVEAGYGKTDYDDPAFKNESESDFSLATVELGMDIRINPYVLGHVLFLYEEEPDADIEVDEGYIVLKNPEGIPVYAMAGRQYLPFGRFESHFISDPLTLELGEIQETSVVGGYANDIIDVFFGLFNGEIDEISDGNDHINTYVAGFAATLAGISGIHITFGGSYLSNITDSDALSEAIADVTGGNVVAEKIGGYSAFASFVFTEKLFFESEILAAVDEFAAGELDSSVNAHEPKTFNLELAYRVTDAIEIAARYGGSDDCGDLLPERLVGGVVSYDIFDNTTLSAEIQRAEFESEDMLTSVTGQLAVCF